MSTYCVRADIEALFGEDNVRAWADLNGNQDVTEIEDRITEAIADASDDVDEVMRGGPYSIPLVDITTLTTPRGIKKITATLAGVWLYNKRGIEDFDQEEGTAKHKLAYNEDEARSQLAEYRASVRRLNATRVGSMTPHAVDHYTEVGSDDNLTSEIRQAE